MYSLEELIKLSRDIEKQEKLNKKKISEFLIFLERIIGEVIDLREEIWVDFHISGPHPNTIFGWNKVDLEWHIVVAQRETCILLGSNEEYVYGDLSQKISDSSKAVQKEVFDNFHLIFERIYQYLMERYETSKKVEEEIIRKIKNMEEILKSTDQTLLLS